MEFGRVAPEELNEINFELPVDPQQTINTLKESNAADNFELRVGATKWGRKEWLGNLYPKETKEPDYLQEYTKHFDGLFLQATFYQVYGPEQITKWKNLTKANPDFKFYPMLAQNISHIRRLRNAEELTAKYIAGVEVFGEKLGSAMLQLGDNFTYKSYPELKAYVEAWPKKIQLFVELRHKEWFTPEWISKIDELFHTNKIGFAITDAPGRRDCVHMHVTYPKALVRFSASGDETLDKQRLDEWALRIQNWKNKGLQSAGFFITGPDEHLTPVLCKYFSSKMK
jgi:uncharacterized protein YecE (DUF72 family)